MEKFFKIGVVFGVVETKNKDNLGGVFWLCKNREVWV